MPNQLLQLWKNLDRRAQGVIVLAVVLCVALLIALTRAGTDLTMGSLYTGLGTEDAAQIVEKLKAAKVPYRLSDGGGTISVPREQIYEQRLALAKEGLPAQGQVGFEIFDRSSLPGTQFSNQVNYQRALQGELARTISAMDEVRTARVHLVLPEESLFADKAKASAAVVLQAKPGRELSPETTAAVAQLVASAVRKVPAGEVTVVDTNGRVLHGPELGNGTGALAGSQLQLREQYETRLAQSLQSMLDAVLGPNQAVVRVRADLDFDSQEVRTEALLPAAGGRGLVTSEKLKEEQYQGDREGTGGTAGLGANLSAPGLAVREGVGGRYLQRDQTREFEYSRNSTAVVKAPGRVKTLSVAAVIDENLPASAEQQVRQVLAAASGLDEGRGDSIAVQRMKISAAETAKTQEEQWAKQERGQRLQTWLQTALRSAMSLVAAFILFLTVNTVLRQVRAATPVAPEAAPVQRDVAVPDTTLPATPSPAPALESAPPEPSPAAPPPADLRELRESLRELAQEDVGAVADRLLAMLQADRLPERV